MKSKYLVSILDTAKENAVTLKLSATTALMVLGPAICSYAAETPPANPLTGDVWTAIQGGFGQLAAACTQVVALSTVTACGIVGMTVAAKYAIKKIKGALSSAA